jgi:hypothetical protein
MIDHLLEIQVCHKARKGYHSLVIGFGHKIQFLDRDNLDGDIVLASQLPDLGDGFSRGIPLQKDLVQDATGTDGFDQGLPANDQSFALSNYIIIFHYYFSGW